MTVAAQDVRSRWTRQLRSGAIVLVLLGAVTAFLALRDQGPSDMRPGPESTAERSGAVATAASPSARSATAGTDGVQAPSDEEAQQAAALEAYFRGRLDEADPRQRLIALSVLTLGSVDPEARRLARAAVARLSEEAPGDPVLAMARTWFCTPPDMPCTDAEHDVWARVDPDNAAARLGTLGRTRSAQAQDAVLARMAAAPAYDAYFQTLALETIAAFDDYVPPPLGPGERRALRKAGFGEDLAARRRFLAVHFIWSMPTPGLSGAAHACRPPMPTARARHCHAVLVRMARASTLIESRMALAVLVELTRGSAEGERWSRELRRREWWSHRIAGYQHGPAYWDDLVRHGEVEAIRRALLRAGLPLDPPRGWRPRYG